MACLKQKPNNLSQLIIFLSIFFLTSCGYFSSNIEEPKYNSTDLVKRFQYNHKQMLKKQEERRNKTYSYGRDLDQNYVSPYGFYDPNADNPSIYQQYYPVGGSRVFTNPRTGNQVIKSTIEIEDPYRYPYDNDSQYTLPGSYRYPSADNPAYPQNEILFDE